MVEDSIDYGYKCPDCNWNINDLEIKNIIGYKEQIIFCEQCGARLVKYIKNDLGEEVQNKQEIEKNSKRYPVEIIANDPDFTDGFIDDLTLVLSRMIYLNIRMLEKNHKIDIEKIEFDEKLLNFIADTIMPILSKEINLLFLKNLHNLSREDFNANLIKLQSKLSTFHIYRQNFIIYFRWLIKETFFIVSESWNKLYLEVFDKIIIEDLKQYNFEDIYSLVENSKLSEYFEENVHGAFFNPIIKFLGKKMPDGSPNIEYYAKEVIDNYWKLVMNTNMRMIGFDSSKMKWKDFSITASQLKVLEQAKIVDDIEDFLGPSGKLQFLWEGFTYVFVDKDTGYFQAGFTKAPFPQRLNYYISHFYNKPSKRISKRSGEMMIYGWVVEKIDKVYGMDNVVDENGEFDYSSFKKLVLKHFDFKITCIYWGDQNLRNSEGEQIALGRVGKADIASKKLLKQHGIIHGFNDGRISELLKKYSLDPKMVGMGLNDSQAAGLGSHKGDSLADQIVLVMAFYVSQGYSHREIFKKLKSEYRYRFGFDAYKNEFRNYFGSLANAYKEFRNPLILKMKADGYSQGEITEFFPRLRIFDDKEFIELAELGLHLGEIAKRLGWDPEYLRKKLVGNLILERFPDLQQYKFTGGKTGAGWEDLQYYLLAKKILTGIYIGKKKTIIKSSMPYLKDDMFDSICEIVLGGKYQELIDEARKALLSIIIYDINPKSIGDVSRDPRNWMSRSILGEKLRKFFMGDALVKKVLQRDGAFYYDALDIGKIALVGNLLKNLYEKGASDNEILTTIGSAYTIEDIKELTAIIWGKTPEEVRKILYSG